MPADVEQRPFCMPSITLILGLLAMGALVACLLWGWNYYMLTASQRPFHPLYNLLRPGGRAGLIWGVLGTLLILFNLSYLLRRHLIGWHRLGSLRVWLGFHMMTGLIAAIAVILHSTLTVSSPLAALAFWCLQLTVVAGLSGMLIYLRLSVSVEGRQTRGHEPSASVKRLLQTWRFLHRWLAILLLMALVLHIIVTVRFGDLWMLGGQR
jgi:hypothetical protein